MENTAGTSSYSSSKTAYDEAPYPSSSFPETHPDKLCAMARLFGVDATAPQQARVLELGCADGANILPMAQHAPDARFVGIDASGRQIATGLNAIRDAGLNNVELRHMDILDFPSSEGKFDYIIAHGIFSWVAETVRSKILEICRDHLSENGVAYISYNAFPGWGTRMALRDMMLFHTASFGDPQAKVGQARALIKFLSENTPSEGNPHGLLLKQELGRMASQPDNYIRHDMLEDTNQPFYFYQFIQRAMAAGLQYLSEPSLDQMLTVTLPPKAAEALGQISGNIIAKEQYMDFIRNRSFRRTLVCHQSVRLSRNLSPLSLKPFYFTSLLAKPDVDAVNFRPGIAHEFKLRTGGDVAITADNTFLKAVFEELGASGLKRISFVELLEVGRKKCAEFSIDKDERDEQTLAVNLLELYTRGFIDIFAARPNFQTSVSEKPSITPLARYQASHSAKVTNRAHVPVPIDTLGRFVMAACDGARSRADIVQHLLDAAKTGVLKINENDQPVQDESRIQMVLNDRLDRVLLQIAAFGFFAA